MAQHRDDILAALATLMSTISGVNTVARTYMNIDITQYTESQLPLIEIKEPEESSKVNLVNMRQLMDLGVELRVFFVSWGEIPTSTYETLIKNIRDAIGNDFTLSGNIVACYVTEIGSIEGRVPVYNFEITLQMEYYLSQKNV